MKVTDVKVREGDRIKIGDVETSNVREGMNGALEVRAVWDGEPDEYAVLTSHVADGEDVEVPDGGDVLSIESGRGLANARVWIAVPTDAYGGGE